jgi:hypothetical protein
MFECDFEKNCSDILFLLLSCYSVASIAINFYIDIEFVLFLCFLLKGQNYFHFKLFEFCKNDLLHPNLSTYLIKVEQQIVTQCI